jgi:protoporphyrinogen oxidase
VPEAAAALRFRGLVTVLLTLDIPSVSQDQWTYFPEETIPFGRMHEPRNWSPELAPKGKTSLVVEYFAFPGDPTWQTPDQTLLHDTAAILSSLRFFQESAVTGGRVDRWPHAYPAYETGYAERVRTLYDSIRPLENAIIAGRTGMFRYHNADHAIETGWEAASALLGEGGNPFKVNTDPGYQEQ